MTTIIIDTKRRLVASDSLMTTEYTTTNLLGKVLESKTTYSKGHQKLFKLKDGVILACCGNVGLTTKVLERLNVPHLTIPYSNFDKGDTGSVIITNPYTNTLAVFMVKAISKKEHYIKKEWCSNYSNIRGGSGEEIAGKCFNKGIAIEDCIRYASYGDKCSGGTLQLMEY
jgi:hypothetical protein